MASFPQRWKVLVTAFLLGMTLCNLALWFRLLPQLRNGYQDFTIFYTGAQLIRSGQASSLYNLATQYRIQQTFTHVPIRLGALPFNHPPFEALLFIPFTLLDYWPAYLLWTALNVIMLAASVILLRNRLPQFAAMSPLTLGLGATAYFPVAMGLIQGQDIILLLLLFVLAVLCLDRGNDVLAGVFLGAGLFRPHAIVALVVLLAVRRVRILVGFIPVALILAAIWVAIMGWRGPVDYLRFVLHFEATRVFGPEAAPNLRGLIADFPGFPASGPWTALLTFAASMVVFCAALLRIRIGRDPIIVSSSLAAVTAILVSFHAFVYDLSLLCPTVLFLLSQTLGVDARRIDGPTILLVFLLFLSPLYIFLLTVVSRFFWFSLILLWLYLRLVRTPAPAEAPA